MSNFRSVTVKLRTGVSHSVLPDHRSMKAGVNYVISYADWKKIPNNAKRTVIEKVGSFSTAPVALKGVVLTHNGAAPPTGWRAGRTIEGVAEGDHFMLVKNIGALGAAGEVYVWADASKFTVKREHAAGDEFAGIGLGALGANNFGWLQVDGEAVDVKVAGAAGAVDEDDLLAVDPTAAAVFRVVTGTDVPVAQAIELSAGAPVTANVQLGKATGRERYVRGRRFINA